VTIVAVLIFLILLELYLAFCFWRKRLGLSWYGIMRKGVYVFDPSTGYNHRPHLHLRKNDQPPPLAPRKRHFQHFITNAEGYVCEEEVEDMARDSKLVFCLGGSTTEGAVTPYEAMYPVVLDRLFREQGVRVVNAGVGGYRSVHELRVLESRILMHRPSAIVLFSGYNDFENYAVFNFSPAELDSPFYHNISFAIPPTRFLYVLEHSAIVHTIRSMLRKIRDNYIYGEAKCKTWRDLWRKKYQRPLNDLAWLDIWKSNVLKIAGLCREHGVKLYLLGHMAPVFPGASDEEKELAETELEMLGRFDFFVHYLELIREAIREVLEQTDAEFLDVGSEFDAFCRERFPPESYARQRYQYFVDRMHFSRLGNAWLAEAVYGKMKETL
jgi:lysophospholipase L1-like esterase